MKVEERHLKNSGYSKNKLATCQPLVFRELHKGSLNNNGRRSSLKYREKMKKGEENGKYNDNI